MSRVAYKIRAMRLHLPALLFFATVTAADTPSTVPPELLTCASISRNSERLACFDHALAALATGKSAGAPATPESSFGLLSSERAPPPKINTGGADLQSVSSTLLSFGRADDGSLVFILENGQRWKQISGADPLLKKGDVVTINRAALGSFQMVMPSGRSAKVRRIN
jgi:hypothetical protein